jgi:uncharacterized membrane protein YhaH (DUF805 family)
VPNIRTARPASPILWLLFSLKGRISRRIYWLSYVLMICLQSALLAQIVGAENASLYRLAASAGPILLIASLFSTFAVSVKRLHDVGYAGFLALAILIPFVNLAFTVWLGILPGNAGANQYGEAPDVPA